MANLYTLKSREEVDNLLNSAANTANNASKSRYSVSPLAANESDDAITSALKSVGNTLGTVVSTVYDWAKQQAQNNKTNNMLANNKEKLNSIAQKYGYQSYNDALNNSDATSAPEMWSELQAQANANVQTANQNASDYKDYVENSTASQFVNQDPTKYLGDAIKTESMLFDVLAPGAGIVANSVQGGLEGLADEMRYNGTTTDTNSGNAWELLGGVDWENAAKRAGVGATVGAVTGAMNKGINSQLSNNNGNIFKGNNKFTKAVNNLENFANNKTAGIAGSAARGATLGAVGGGVGGGLTAALNGGNVGEGIAQGALSGAGQGAAMGTAFGGLNAIKNKVQNPQVAEVQKTQVVEENPVEETTTAKDITSVFESDETPIQKRNKLQSLGNQLETTSNQIKYQDVYGSLDAKTAKRAVETSAPQKLTDLGVKPQDYTEYAKTSNYVNKVASDLASESGVKINAPDLTTKLTSIDDSIIMSDTAQKKYNNIVRQIVADGDTPTEYSASYLLEKSRELGNKAANLRGNTDDVTTLRSALTDAKYTLRDLATEALTNAEITGDLTNDNIANGLKSLGANEKVIDYYTAPNADGSAPTVKDYIARSSLFEQARDMGTQMAAEKLTRSASKEPTNPLTQVYNATGVNKVIELAAKNAVAPAAGLATNVAGKAISAVGNAGAKVGDVIRRGTTTPTINTTNMSTQLWNALGRNVGENEAANNYVAEAAQEQTQNNNAVNNTNTLEELASTNNYGTSVSSLTGNSNTGTTGTATTGTTSTTYNSGNSQLDLLARAMDLARAAGDATAFGQLYEMYASAAENAGTSSNDVSSWSSSAKSDLTEAMNALDQIDTLEQLYNEAGGGQGWLEGGIANITSNIGNMNTAGATYNDYANSIGTALVKNLVNLGATESDVKRYVDYIPSLSDTQEQASSKLEKLRTLYQSVINNLYSVNG